VKMGHRSDEVSARKLKQLMCGLGRALTAGSTNVVSVTFVTQ